VSALRRTVVVPSSSRTGAPIHDQNPAGRCIGCVSWTDMLGDGTALPVESTTRTRKVHETGTKRSPKSLVPGCRS
jgi:hypothetical protein